MKVPLTRQQKQLVIKYIKGWENNIVKGWAESVTAKLAAENLSTKSRWKDIKDCLGKVVCPDLAISIAYILKFVKG